MILKISAQFGKIFFENFVFHVSNKELFFHLLILKPNISNNFRPGTLKSNQTMQTYNLKKQCFKHEVLCTFSHPLQPRLQVLLCWARDSTEMALIGITVQHTYLDWSWKNRMESQERLKELCPQSVYEALAREVHKIDIELNYNCSKSEKHFF